MRFGVNAPRAVAAVGAAYLVTGGKAGCDMREGLMVACTGVPRPFSGGRQGWTFGNTYLTGERRLTDQRMRHEAAHATQWAIVPNFPALYAADVAADWVFAEGDGDCQLFEI